MKNINDYLKLFNELDQLDVTQFKSYISASQYLLAYKLVLHHAHYSASILDWGTGTGHFSLFLLEEKFKVSGFSIEKDCTLAHYLSTKFPDQYNYVSDPQSVKTLPFETNSFDIVTSIGVLEHVREKGGNEVDSLREIRRILKPGGIFICYHLPNKYSWIEVIAKYLLNKYNHLYKCSRRDIQVIISEANFELLETKRYGLFPRLSFRNFSDNLMITTIFNYTDVLLSNLLNPICQNHYLIARKSS